MTPRKLRITDLREALGITQAELSRRTGINATTISLISHGRFIPYDGQLYRLKMALHFAGDPHELLEPADR